MLLENIKPYRIILASESPRRKELLSGMGISFETITTDINEDIDPLPSAQEHAIELSRLKSEAIPEEYLSPSSIVITADTVVALDGKILGKPANRDEAFSMLQQLSGKKHQVVTAVTFRHMENVHSFASVSSVGFTSLTRQEIEYYTDTCMPYDKAGSYGIQEWIGYIGINYLEGSFYNVMGLPTQRLYHELDGFIDRLSS